MTGVSPPDQMFAWHQAMFVDKHRHYPQDPFLTDMDLYDRPQLGGYLTLFFFKLFHLPLTGDNLVYPPSALRFYHCFWWLLNNLYLWGVAPLFRRIFGYRGAIIGVASTALGGFFFLCNAGGWMKFSSTYPFLLAFLLFLENQGPWLQAVLCAISYHIHGSVLPFLAGFGILQLLSTRYPIIGRRVPVRAVARFGLLGAVLVGAWFFVVRWVGSKQPLFYYYVYGAGISDAQIQPVAEIAKAFYARNTWASLSLLPAHNLLASWLPVAAFHSIKSWVWLQQPLRLSDLANLLFASQRFCIECALGLTAAPVVIAVGIKTLARKQAGKIAFCLYLIPTLIVALAYRIDWAFSLHILMLYHALCLFFWVSVLRSMRFRYVLIGLAMIAAEGIACVLFADLRFLPANGLNLTQIPSAQFAWLGVYLALILVIIGAACKELERFPHSGGVLSSPQPGLSLASVILITGRKMAFGLVVIALVIGIYSLYCLRFYPAR